MKIEKGDKYTLQSFEIITCRTLAMLRNMINQRDGLTATPYCDGDLDDNNALALGAELAFCAMANIYPDLRVDRYPFRPYDCVTRLGIKIDVKHSKDSDAPLRLKMKDGQSYADLYVLMTGTGSEMVFRGAARLSDLVRPERINRSNKHPFFCMPQRDLLPLIDNG